MAVCAVTYTFASLTDAKASEVNRNFADLVNFINANLIQKDASVAFTAIPSGPASDPVSDNQFTRKAYVDKLGVIAQHKLITDTAAFSGDIATGMQLLNVSVVAGHTYAIHLNSKYSLSASGAWSVECHLNGAKIGEFATIDFTTSTFGTIDATVYWTAPATQATDDITVFANETGGSATLQLQGAANTPRFLTMTGLGVI